MIHKLCTEAYQALDPVEREANELTANTELLAYFKLAADEKNIKKYTALVESKGVPGRKWKLEPPLPAGADPAWTPVKLGSHRVWRREREGRPGEFTYAVGPEFATVEQLLATLPSKKQSKPRKMDAFRLFVKESKDVLGGRAACLAAWAAMVGPREGERERYRAEAARMNEAAPVQISTIVPPQ